MAAKTSSSKRKTEKTTPKKSLTARKSPRKWSAKVTETSDALDLEGGVFKSKSAAGIAKSVKSAAEKSKRKKAGPYQSAMSMLNFYENRAGKNLPKAQNQKIETAKKDLRKEFGRDPE